jgi:hypothetical protein
MDDWAGLATIVTVGISVLGIVIGTVVSIRSTNFTRQKEAEARRGAAEKDAQVTLLEAQKPFLKLRQKLYTEAVRVAVILTNPSIYTREELEAAKKRFRELYVAELSMVEAPEVEAKMVRLAQEIDPELTHLTPAQSAAYELSHALRDSFAADYRLQE